MPQRQAWPAVAHAPDACLRRGVPAQACTARHQRVAAQSVRLVRECCTTPRRRAQEWPSPGADVARGELSPGADVARGEPSDVARGEPSPGTDVAGTSSVPVRM